MVEVLGYMGHNTSLSAFRLLVQVLGYTVIPVCKGTLHAFALEHLSAFPFVNVQVLGYTVNISPFQLSLFKYSVTQSFICKEKTLCSEQPFSFPFI